MTSGQSLVALRRAVAELRVCRRRRPHRLPAAGRHPDPLRTRTTAAHARSAATTAAANGSGRIPFDDLPVAARSARRLDRQRQQRRRRWRLSALHRPGVGPGLPGRADHRPHQQLRRRRPDRRRARRDPVRQLAAAGARHRAAPGRARRPRPRTAGPSPRGSRPGTAPAASTAYGCAAWNAWEYRVMRDLFDDELGPDLARDYAGSPFSWVLLSRLAGGSEPTTGGTTCRRPAGPSGPTRSSPGRWTRPGAELRAAIGSPDRWSWGRPPHGHLPRGDAGHQRDRAARVVLRRRAARRPGHGRAPSTTPTTASRRPTPTRRIRPTARSASTTSST